MQVGGKCSPSSCGSQRAARSRGALADLVPVLAIALLFAVGGTTSKPAEIAVSLGLVTMIAMSAGWVTGLLGG